MSAPLHLRVIGKTGSNGIGQVSIRAGVRDQFGYSPLGEFETDSEGDCVVSLPEGSVPTLLLCAFRHGYVPRFVRWAVDHGEVLPSDYTLALEKAVMIGGLVRNEEGQLVEGAAVTLQSGPRGYEAGAREWSALERDRFPVRTDPNGLWRSDFAPSDLSDLTIYVSHNDYARTHCVIERRDSLHETQVLEAAALLDHTALIVLSPGFSIRGRITGPGDQPVLNANITLNSESFGQGRQSVRSGQDGTFLLPRCPMTRFRRSGFSGTDLDRFRPEDRWKAKLIVEAEGLAPAIRKLSIEERPPEFEIRLAEAAPVGGRVLDAAGQPVAGVHVSLQWQPEGESAARQGVTHFWRTETNDQGEFAWNSAPAGPLKGYFARAGYTGLRVGSRDRSQFSRQIPTDTSPYPSPARARPKPNGLGWRRTPLPHCGSARLWLPFTSLALPWPVRTNWPPRLAWLCSPGPGLKASCEAPVPGRRKLSD